MLAFEMERPRSLAAAVEILGKYGSKAMIKAGGTDVLVWMRKHAVNPEMLVDLSEIPELGGISFYSHKGIKIGAMCTVNQVAEHEDLPGTGDRSCHHLERQLTDRVEDEQVLGAPRRDKLRDEHRTGDQHRAQVTGDTGVAVDGGAQPGEAVLDQLAEQLLDLRVVALQPQPLQVA